MANVHTTLTSLFDDIADAIRENTPVTEQIKADAFPAYIRMLGYDGTIPSTPSVLNSCSWDFIRWCSDEGIAELLWSVGDRKEVQINDFGNVQGKYQIPGGTFYCYILGFNHNAALEGNNLTHFEFGFTSLSGGAHIAFAGGDYRLSYTDPGGNNYPIINTTQTNSGGWESSYMRTVFLDTGSSRTFFSSIPEDLRTQIKTVTKYTDNTGNSSVSEGNVTSTEDRIFLLNQFELGGVTNSSNPYEANKSLQYQYYKNGEEKTRYKSNDTTTAVIFVLRSPYRSDSRSFVRFGNNGIWGYTPANHVVGISPAFCV